MSSVKSDSRNSMALKVATMLIIVSRALSFAINPAGNLLPDSPSYLPNRWLEFNNVSLFGNAQRTWVTPLMYSLLPNNSARILVQLFIGALTWILILNFVSKLDYSPNKKCLAIFMTLIFGLSPNLIQFETSLLATSLLINLTLLYIVQSIKVVLLSDDKLKNSLSCLILGWLVVTLKITNLPLVTTFLILSIWKTKLKLFKRYRVFQILIVSSLILNAIFVNYNNNVYWKNTYSATTILWHLGDQSPDRLEFKKFLVQQKAPVCLTQNAPYRDISTEIERINSKCPEGVIFIKKNLTNSLARFLISNPQSSFKLISTGFAVALTGASRHYGTSVSLIPAGINEIYFGSVSPDFRIGSSGGQKLVVDRTQDSEPLWIFIPPLVILILGLFLSILYWRRHILNKVITLIMLLCLVELAFTTLILPSEWFRQGVQYTTPSLLVGMLSIIFNVNLAMPHQNNLNEEQKHELT